MFLTLVTFFECDFKLPEISIMELVMMSSITLAYTTCGRILSYTYTSNEQMDEDAKAEYV
jgi:hypothetical protein